MTGDSGKALPETAGNASSRGQALLGVFRRLKPLWIGLLAAAVVGALLTIAADFATLRSVTVITASCGDLADPATRGECVTRGHEEHAYALVIIGLAALVMAWGATTGRSRPAAIALAVLGAAVLVIALATDVPDIHKTGPIGDRFESARAEAGPGLWMELAGGVLLFVSGVISTAAGRGRRRRAERDRRRRRKRAAA